MDFNMASLKNNFNQMYNPLGHAPFHLMAEETKAQQG